LTLKIELNQKPLKNTQFLEEANPGYTKESAQAALMNQGHRQRSLNDEYRSAVLARFKISEEQLEQISNEASEENWPLVGE
jgi:hypothetical protein